jgi:hypothetical protein
MLATGSGLLGAASGCITRDSEEATTQTDGTQQTRQPTGGRGPAASPNIVVFEDDDGQARAVSEDTAYEGEDVFAAAQRAIDARLQEERPGYKTAEDDAPGVDLHVRFKPGLYTVENTLSVIDGWAERVVIDAPGKHGARFETAGVPESEDAILTVAPVPEVREEPFPRVYGVTVSGIDLFGDAERAPGERVRDGFHFDSVSHLLVEHCRANGYRRGLWIRNIWQGKVDHFITSRTGNPAAEAPSIAVGIPGQGGAPAATNHVEFNHLQGDPGGTGFGHAYLETYGQVSRIDINFPNPELGEPPGFVINGGPIRKKTNALIRGPQLTGGAPAIDVRDAARVVVSGGRITADGSAINSPSGPITKLVVGNVELQGGNGEPVVSANSAWFSMGNFRVENSDQGVVVDNCQFANVNNGIIRNCSRAGLVARNLGGIGYVFGNLTIAAAKDDQAPILLDDVDTALVDTITASAPRQTPAVQLNSTNNVELGTILTGGEVTGVQ